MKNLPALSRYKRRGVFVEIISNKCEGFMKDIPDDYFVYDFKTNIIGQNTKEEYCLESSYKSSKNRL